MANYHKRKKKMANSNKHSKKRHRMSATSSSNAVETSRPAREQSSNISTLAGSTQVSPLPAQSRPGGAAAAAGRIQTLVVEQQQPPTSNPTWSTSTASSSPRRTHPQPGSSATPDHSVISELTPEDGQPASESSSDEDATNDRSQRSAGQEDEEHDLVVQHHHHHAHKQHQQQVAAYRVSMNEVGVYTAPQSRTQGGFDCPPMRPDQRPQPSTNQQPIIIVEPHNDDSMQCDCRQCHFFSGWFCMPCAVLMIILLVVAICVLRARSADAEHEHSASDSHKQPAQNSTQAAQNILSTTVSTILANSSKYLSPQNANNNSRAALRERLLEGAAYEFNRAR